MKTSLTGWLLLAFLFSQNIASAQIVNIEERRITGTNDSTDWYGFVRLAATVSKVKDDIFQFNATGQVQHKQPHSLTLLLLDARLLRAGKQDFTRSGFAHLRYNRDLTERLVWEAFAQAQANKLLLIEQRTLAGTGLRYRIFKSSDGKNRLYAGLAGLREHTRFLENNGDESWWRLSSYLSFTLRPWEGVALISTTYFQPQVEDFGNYRLSSEWRLDTPLGKRLSFNSTFSYSIDRSLPPAAPTDIYSWVNGLTFRF